LAPVERRHSVELDVTCDVPDLRHATDHFVDVEAVRTSRAADLLADPRARLAEARDRRAVVESAATSLALAIGARHGL
jgi:hypothetical protein